MTTRTEIVYECDFCHEKSDDPFFIRKFIYEIDLCKCENLSLPMLHHHVKKNADLCEKCEGILMRYIDSR